MSNRSIAALSFRLAGIYALIQLTEHMRSLVYISTIHIWPVRPPMSTPSGREINQILLADASVSLLLAILTWILIFKADRLAARTFPDPEVNAESRPILEVHAFAYSVVGIFLACSGLSQLIYMWF